MRRVYRACFALVCVAPRALATPPDEARSAPDAGVDAISVVLIGSADLPELRALVIEWVAPTGLSIRVDAQRTLTVDEVLAADRTERRVRVWVTATPKRARLYLADRGAEHFLVRDVPLEGGLDELGREQVAQVLLSAALAFMEKREETPASEVRSALVGDGGETPVPLPPRARPARPPVHRAPGASARFRGSISARYLGRYAGPEGVIHGPGASAAAGIVWERASLALSVEARAELPHRAPGQRLELEIAGISARAGLVVALATAPRQLTALEVVCGARWVTVDATSGSSSITPRPVDDWRPSLGIALSHGIPIGPLRLVLGATLDIDLVHTDYAVRVDGVAQPELSPWQVQPGAFAGVAWP